IKKNDTTDHVGGMNAGITFTMNAVAQATTRPSISDMALLPSAQPRTSPGPGGCDVPSPRGPRGITGLVGHEVGKPAGLLAALQDAAHRQREGYREQRAHRSQHDSPEDQRHDDHEWREVETLALVPRHQHIVSERVDHAVAHEHQRCGLPAVLDEG